MRRGRGSLGRRRKDGGFRGTSVPEVAALGHAVAEQVQCLGSPFQGGGRPRPNWGLERGIVSLSSARRGDGATHHLELKSRCDYSRIGRSEFS